MTENVVDDEFTIIIQVESPGDLIITDINVPPYVELKIPFTMTYTVRNKKPEKQIYGVLIDSIRNNVFFKSFWTETFTGDKMVSYTFERGTTADMNIRIQIGEP